jgi:peptidoglycan/xylan/chitin deacetylase (PgdA/CDA1 family)
MKWFIGVAALAVAMVLAALFLRFGDSPPLILTWIASAFPDGIFYVETNEKVVALTIDDVPGPDDPGDASTQLILDAIAEHNAENADPALNVHATFFVIAGNLAEGSTIIDRIRQEGHEIGNHGRADGMDATLSPDMFAEQLRSSHERLASFTDQPIRWYRPGRGLFNAAMVQALQAMDGYEARFALVSMLPIDTFWPAGDPRFTAWYVSRHVFPGAILVVHGGSPQQSARTAEALRMILGELRQRDYRAVTVSELWGSQ